MPNRLERDANGVLVPKILIGGLPDGIVVNADIASASLQASKLDYFLSAETTGTGSEQDIAHGLGRTPALVLVTITQKDTTTAVQITEGTHDGTNVKVDCPTTAKFKVFAL